MDIDTEKICKMLEEAKEKYMDVPPNQLGMPAHLLHVATLFAEVKDEIYKLEKRCIKESNRWMRNAYGYPNNSNNNNNNTTRKRKRTNSPKSNK